MQSCLYECHVMHHRFTPKVHRFAYRIFMMALDLDELDALHRRLRLFSVNRPNLYAFRERDHLPASPAHNPSPLASSQPSLSQKKCHVLSDTPHPASSFRPAESAVVSHLSANPQKCHVIRDTPERITSGSRASETAAGASSLKARVLAHLSAHGIDLTGGRVVLVTLPRILGYLFKPVSFYFCYDRHGHPVASLAEVTNTFHELKLYTLGPDSRVRSNNNAHASDTPSASGASSPPASAPFRLRVPKHFYVSPFSDVDVAFDFTLRPPGERLSVQIDDYEGSQRTLTTTLAGPRRPLTDAALAWYLFKYPLLTLRVITLIHWHALRLWLKRVPWFAKSASASDQRDLHHPHASFTAPPSPPSSVPHLRPSALPR